MGTIVHEERLERSFGSGEDYDAVPVVGGIYLGVRTFGLEDESVGRDAVVAGEDVGHSLGATLREFHVVGRCTGVLVGIAAYYNLGVGVGLEIFGDVVYVDHFLRRYVGRIDLEAYGGEESGRSALDFHCFGYLGAGELGLGGCKSGRCSGECAAQVVDLSVGLVECVYVVAGVVAFKLRACEVDDHTAGGRDVEVDGAVKHYVVVVVAIEHRTSLGKEVDIGAYTEAELNAGRYGKHPLVVFDASGLMVIVGTIDVAEVIDKCAAESYVGDDLHGS